MHEGQAQVFLHAFSGDGNADAVDVGYHRTQEKEYEDPASEFHGLAGDSAAGAASHEGFDFGAGAKIEIAGNGVR